MTPEELSQIRKIYEQALPLAPDARQAYLNAECPSEENLRPEVDRLLKAHGNIPSWLDNPILGTAAEFQAPDPPTLEGRNLSGYTLVREIGRGGMGTVYFAERSDDTFHRQVAVKLVLPPFATAAVVSRFQQEREILGSLDHPNIAKLFDAGVTAEGWPYFVMEYVEGQPIHRWCDERKLNVSQRVELFRGVIEAVQYAHRHLVVHRDLKPGNILVTSDGVVKLLDFGIAKVVASNPMAGQNADTLTLAAMMTPEYASPEQVNGTVITTQSDVYSLGVVLYELLTGHRPYQLLSAAMHEVARVILEVEPARPSDVVAASEPSPFGRDRRIPITPEVVSATREGDPNRLRKRLLGDLDAILLMALRKEPQQRYGSAESFGDDLQRHLEQRVIHAREATPWEKLTRFWWRNRGAFTIGGAMVATFFCGLVAVIRQTSYIMEMAAIDPRIEPLPVPLWLFALGPALGAQLTAVYLSRAYMPERLKRRRFGAIIGGIIWALAMTGRWWVERNQGWWHSRIPDFPDPLTLVAPRSFGICVIAGNTLTLTLFMIGRRYGWKGQAIAVLSVGLVLPLLERFWFSELIPALQYQPFNLSHAFGSAGILIAASIATIVATRLIGGPYPKKL